MVTRRKLLTATGYLAATPLYPAFAKTTDKWSKDRINHLIPLVNKDSILLKVSFSSPQHQPHLKIGRKKFEGRQMDSFGRFWSFHATGLESNQGYELNLRNRKNTKFADSWPISTAPGQADKAEQIRILIYTCAGGPDNAQLPDGQGIFQPIEVRRRLLQRATSFSPDLAIGVGDQVYWDQSQPPRRDTEQFRQMGKLIYGHYGQFDEDLPVFGSENELTLQRCLDEQIASLYGTDFRSVPTILTQDDHDHFENDEANDRFITFPPRNFALQLARASQRMYFPEYLPDINRPTHLAGSRANGMSESYGSFRWGKLAELLLYDCRRFLSLKGPSAGFVEEAAERWLGLRTRSEKDARHLIHIPSTPLGWSAGKWGEWYPDLLDEDGSLSTRNPKPYWQSGWFEQHQRLLNMIASQKDRIPLMVSGDLHAIASGIISGSGDLNLDRSVNSILAGPISSDDLAWPSNFRGVGAMVPTAIKIDERTKPLENNGFTLLDIDPEGISVRQFAWHKSRGIGEIDSLDPISTFRL